MNEKELIKALELCVPGGSCKDCPLRHQDNCVDKLHIALLEQITAWEDALQEKTEQVESLSCQVGEMVDEKAEWHKKDRDLIENAKAEAVTEFADMLKDHFSSAYPVYADSINADIDDMAKEFTE